MEPYAAVRERLDRGQVVVLDGGIGSVLVQRGIRWRDHALRTDSAAVQALHEEYLHAGVDVLRTNTFQLNRRVYRNVFRDEAHMRHIGAPDLAERVPKLISAAVDCARAARKHAQRDEVAIAGVMSPLEHCFRPDLTPPAEQAASEHSEIARLLADAGVDVLLLESMNTLAEARCAIEAAHATGPPVWVSFGVGLDGNVLSGESLQSALDCAREVGVEAILVSGAPPGDISRAVDKLGGAGGVVYGACAFIGRFDPPSWKFEFFPQFTQTDLWPPEQYASVAETWRARGARIIGGGNGTTPDHIRAVVEAFA